MNIQPIDIDKRLINSRQSISTDTQLIVDKINDPELGTKFIDKAIKKLGFHDVASIAVFSNNIVRQQGGHTGKLFVSICNKQMKA